MPVAESVIDELVVDGDLVRAERWIYRAQTAALEAELAERIDAMLAGLPQPAPTQSAPIVEELTDEQSAGVLEAFAHRLSVITGGPGTGKTASIKTIAGLAASQGARVMLVAPTGRAAIRMTEASGVRALTVHSALGWIPGEGPTHNEDDPLMCDLLIVDESSMANLELLVTLLRAVGGADPRRARRRRRSARPGGCRQAVRRVGRVPRRCRPPVSPTSSARPPGA